MKFLYYIAAIGNPDLDKKLSILEYNLKYIYNDLNEKFDIIVNLYDIYNINKIEDLLYSFNFLENIYIYCRKGVLTELFLQNTYNENLDSYDYIMFILDDVQIEYLNIKEMIDIKDKYGIEIISPKVNNSTHLYMNKYNSLTINNFLEIYCLLMSPVDIRKFFSLYNLDNKWMWGIDLLFGYYNIRVAVFNKFVVDHKLPSKSDGKIAYYLMEKYFKENTCFNKFYDVINKYNPIIKEINDY